MKTMNDFSTALRQARARKAWSVAKLSRLSGISRATIAGIEDGTGNPTLSIMTDLATAFGVSVVDLLIGKAGPRYCPYCGREMAKE